jgi:serine/threonine protein kinase
MASEKSDYIILERTLSERFNIEHHLASTRTADLYRGYDKHHSGNINIWLMKHSLSKNSSTSTISGVDRFLSRLGKILSIDTLPLCRVYDYGVDSEGSVFAVLEPFFGQSISLVSRNFEEAVRRVVQCVQIVSELHRHDIVCGDISLNSFWMNKVNNVTFAAIMGSFDIEANATSAAPPLETLHFISPEQRAGQGVDFASDVYSLGILIYYLFADDYPPQKSSLGLVGGIEPEMLISMGSLYKNQVQWPDIIIKKCLARDPQERYTTASGLLKDIEDLKKREASGEMLPVVYTKSNRRKGKEEQKSESTLVKYTQFQNQQQKISSGIGGMQGVAGQNEREDVSSASDKEGTEKDRHGFMNQHHKENKARDQHLSGMVSDEIRSKATTKQRRFLRTFDLIRQKNRENKHITLPIAIIVIVVSVIILYEMLFSSNKQPVNALKNQVDTFFQSSASPELRQAYEMIISSKASFQEKEKFLKRLENSDETLVHELLVKAATTVKEVDERERIEKGVIDRLIRLKYFKTSELLKQWLTEGEASAKNDEYTVMLRSLNPAQIPFDARSELLLEAYKKDPANAIKFICSLALDTKQVEQYKPLLASILLPKKDENTKIPDLSTFALILSDQKLAEIFGNEILSSPDKILNSDIPWILEEFAARGDSRLDTIAKMGVERGIVPNLRKNFLKLLNENSSIHRDISVSLVKAAMGKYSTEDLRPIAQWYEPGSETALLTICADSPEAAVYVDAFETLAVKNLTLEPAASLIYYIKDTIWEQRNQIAKIVCMLTFFEVIPQEAFHPYKAEFERLINTPELIEILLKKGSPSLNTYIVDNYISQMNLTTLLEILEIGEKKSKLKVLEQLKGYNDVGVMKFVLERYRKEKDEDIRKKYKDDFWYIKQRESE